MEQLKKRQRANNARVLRENVLYGTAFGFLAGLAGETADILFRNPNFLNLTSNVNGDTMNFLLSTVAQNFNAHTVESLAAGIVPFIITLGTLIASALRTSTPDTHNFDVYQLVTPKNKRKSHSND